MSGQSLRSLQLAIDRKPMSYASMGELITETTRMTIGVAASPHLFRVAAATTLAIRAGDKPHAGSAVLHHGPYGPIGRRASARASLSLPSIRDIGTVRICLMSRQVSFAPESRHGSKFETGPLSTNERRQVLSRSPCQLGEDSTRLLDDRSRLFVIVRDDLFRIISVRLGSLAELWV